MTAANTRPTATPTASHNVAQFDSPGRSPGKPHRASPKAPTGRNVIAPMPQSDRAARLRPVGAGWNLFWCIVPGLRPGLSNFAPSVLHPRLAPRRSIHHSSFIIHRSLRRSFTLAELLIVMMFMAIMASMTLFALWGVMEDARAARTQAQVAKLNELVMARWESYRTRPVRVTYAPVWTAQQKAFVRLRAVRELMRLEMPDRITDVDVNAFTPGQVLTARPALSQQYLKRSQQSIKPWSPAYQGAECLYLIVASIQEGDSNGLDFFKSSEIGDVDGDDRKEILDAWGNPIEFVRWPAGLESPLQPVPRDVVAYPDPFDPLRADPRWSDANATVKPFAMFPLVYSPGADKVYDIQNDLNINGSLRYNTLPNNPPNVYGLNDPYCADGAGISLGKRLDPANGGTSRYFDNITNHFTGDY